MSGARLRDGTATDDPQAAVRLTAVRIIAGELRGRRIEAPKGTETRPTSDFVRETAFNLIGPVDGAIVLDLYAGSGALGLEALSRGAERCALRRQLARGLPHDRRRTSRSSACRATVLCQDAERALAAERGPYDLILADPPYDFDRLRAPRAAPRPAPRRRTASPSSRPRPPREPALDGPRQCVPPAATAPHALRCSSCDHRHLPRLLRPRHERARRRDRRAPPRSSTASSSASSATRSTRRRSSRSRSASTSLREAVAADPERRGRRLQGARRRVRAPLGGDGDRQGPARHLRLRVGVPDEPAEPDARARRSRPST